MTDSTETTTADAAPPDRRGLSAPPGSRGLAPLKLPERGDRAATRWFIAGVGFYAVVGIIFVAGVVGSDLAGLLDLIGLGEPFNPSLLVLVLGGVGLTAYGAFTVLRDLRTIRAEEEDIEWLRVHKREGAALVLAPAAERERLFRQGHRTVSFDDATVETLVDDRVRRAHSVQMTGRSAVVAVEELRAIAERRTARLGGFARYATSLLLLFAVLGTFAGVKTALPGLIEAVTEAAPANVATGLATDASTATAPAPQQEGSTTGPGSNPTALREPLKAVADAFGGNALALIGAIAVGLMAQGITSGRRHLLERLELVSAEYIYTEDPRQAADPLKAAVGALHETAQEIHRSAGVFVGIETGLEALGGDFRAAFEALDDRLHQLLSHQEAGLYDRTSKALEELQARVSNLAQVVEANTLAYQGLVDRIGDRADESAAAIAQMRSANEKLGEAMSSVVGLGSAAESLARQADERAKSVQEQGDRVEAELSGQVDRIAAELGGLNVSIQEAATASRELRGGIAAAMRSLEEGSRRSAENLARVGTDVCRDIKQAVNSIPNQIARASRSSAGGPAGLDGRSAFVLPLLGAVTAIILLVVMARVGLLQSLF